MLFSVSPLAEAAQFSATSPFPAVRVDDEFLVTAWLDTEGEDINATEGRLSFPHRSLELKKIYENDSVMNLWVEKPRQDADGSVVWSGIIPGGFEGVLSPYYTGTRPGKLFSLLFKAQQPGSATVYFANARALLDDGKGTGASVTSSGVTIGILPSQGGTATHDRSVLELQSDKEPPGEFTPEVSRDPSLFGGDWFVVFSTDDKGTGVDHYDIYESRFNWKNIGAQKWTLGESPYHLRDQSRQSYIYVKAVDRVGNARIAVVTPQNPMRWYEIWYLYVILIAIVGVAFWLRKQKE
ncbi:MAG: hypothetical protein V1696_03640 [Candidatus Jorgensenbacteria bacterium]